MNIKFVLKIFFAICCLYILLVIRARDFGRYPIAGNSDELNYGWSGISLIQEGKPFGWSYHKAYPESWVFYDGIIDRDNQIQIGGRMVRPWLDEPPLFSLLAGGSAHLYGQKAWSVLSSGYIRIPSIIFGFGTTIVLWLWGGPLVAVIYTLTPLITFSSRLALPENGISFLFTLSLYLYWKFKERALSVIAVLIGLAGLMKPTGFFILFLFLFFEFKEKHFKQGLYFFLKVLPFVFLFLSYYWWLGGFQAFDILKVQGFRPTGWTSLSFILNTPIFSTGSDTFYDGWYVFSIFSSFILLAMRGKTNKLISYLAFAIMFWFGIVMASAGEQDALAWYRYPIFPLISFMAAIAVKEMLENPTWWWGFLSVGLLLSSRFYLHNAFIPTTSTGMYKAVLILLAIPFAWFEIFQKEMFINARKYFLVGILAVGLLFNARYIYSVFSIRCDSITCPIQQEMFLSSLKLPILWRLLVPSQYIIK